MNRPTKDTVYAADAGGLHDLATSLRTGLDTVGHAAGNVHHSIHELDWLGVAHDAAIARADRELTQNRALLSAGHQLADAYDDGATAMSPLISSLTSQGHGLEADGYAISQDWVVSDTYHYEAARALCDLFGVAHTKINTIEAQRAQIAADATTTLGALADDLGAADTATKTAIAAAVTEITAAAPSTSPAPTAFTVPSAPRILTVDNTSPADENTVETLLGSVAGTSDKPSTTGGRTPHELLAPVPAATPDATAIPELLTDLKGVGETEAESNSLDQMPFPIGTTARPDKLPSAAESINAARDRVGLPPLGDPRNDPQAMDAMRQLLASQGVPADRIDQGINTLIDAINQPLTYTGAPEHAQPPPGFTDGFRDAWFGTEQRIKELFGQGGPGAPTVLDAWKNFAVGIGETFNLYESVPKFIDHLLNAPSAAYLAGELTGSAAISTPALILGPETLAGRAALNSGIEIPHVNDLPAATFKPTIATDDLAAARSDPPVSGQHTPSIVPENAGPTGHSYTGTDRLPFETGMPIDTARPEFNLSNPLDYMSPRLTELAEQHITGSGETVLGPYAPRGGGPSYIEVAQQTGASYFDIGDAWSSSTPTQQLAANQHVLNIAIENRDTVRLSVPIDQIKPDTYTGAEIRYLQAHGYEVIDNRTLAPPGR